MARRLTGIKKRNDVRMVQSRRELYLAQEPVRSEGGAELGMKHLQRDAALVPEIHRQVHGRHSAAAQLTVEVVARDQRRLETFMHRQSSRHRLHRFSRKQLVESGGA